MNVAPILLMISHAKFKFDGTKSFVVIPFLSTGSKYNLAYAMAAQLWCYVKIVAITLSRFGWKQNQIFIEYELHRQKIVSEMGLEDVALMFVACKLAVHHAEVAVTSCGWSDVM